MANTLRTARRITPVIETLESRALFSASVSGSLPDHGVAAFAAKVKVAATKTTLTAKAGTLGQPVTFTVTVKTAAAAGSPAGIVEIFDHKTVIQAVTLAPAASANPKQAVSEATYTFNQTIGGAAYFFGKHAVSAVYVPAGTFAKSGAAGAFNVAKPVYTAFPDGVKFETIAAGSGAGIAAGQIANVFYTGYLAKNGKIFDDSINDGGTPFNFTVGAGDVITGFDEGTVGMTTGETRIIDIPPAEGYGKTTNGPIPGKSTLLFVITLESIS
jgi:hypothetical protein